MPAKGSQQDFWVGYQQNDTYHLTKATLLTTTAHADFYLEEGLAASSDAVTQTAAEFERVVYPVDTAYFGALDRPGLNGDSRVTVLVALLRRVDGYYSSFDQYPRTAYPYSNERHIIYLSSGAAAFGTPAFTALLAHEFQHLLHGLHKPALDNWISEGSSELAMKMVGAGMGGHEASFLADPDVQLTAWAGVQSPAGPHYGAAYLFLRYFADRFGQDALPALAALPGRGSDLFDNYLGSIGARRLRFDDIFLDWVVANYLNDPGLENGRYGYTNSTLRTHNVRALSVERPVQDSVSQFGARYYSLPQVDEPLILDFAGAATTRLLPTTARSGRYYWWGNRGDVVNSKLTVPVDLRGVGRATLRFWTWYEIERSFDYVYLVGSKDGGRSWLNLGGKFTSALNPTGNNLGQGWTGISGGGPEPIWVQEEVDLSPLSGQEVLLRFEYVTDDGYNGAGFALDDLQVPEVGFLEDGEGEGVWGSEGFLRTDGVVLQQYALRLVREGAEKSVVEVQVDENQHARLLIPAGRVEGERLTLVVAALAPLTTERAPMRISLRVVSPAEPAS